ncbi:MAG: 50S ribosomal protein L30 [Clostridia bacterium]|nr:50S ribosomal protein L30 [Clostridia bacterium]
MTLVKSTIACLEDQIRTVEALGLKKLHQSKVVELNDAISGMLYRVRHLVSVEDIDE